MSVLSLSPNSQITMGLGKLLDSLIWLLRYRRDESGEWVPAWCPLSSYVGGISCYIMYVFFIYLFAGMICDGLRRVRQRQHYHWFQVWWAASGYAVLLLTVISHAYRPWSLIGIITSIVLWAWVTYGIWLLWNFWKYESSDEVNAE